MSEDILSFCYICVGSIRAHDGTPIDDLSHLEWDQRARSVRTRESYRDPFLTGAGFVNYHGELIAERIGYTHDHVRPAETQGVLEAHAIRSGDDRTYWCFPFHEVCWQLVLHRARAVDKTLGPSRIAPHLFALFYNMPAGATREVVYGRFRSLLYREPREVRNCSDLDPDEDFDFLVPKPEQLSSPPLAMSGVAENHDVFAKLPSEIILLVIESIPTASLSSLRHASRSVAAVSQPELLNQSFWHSRFQNENEMAFVFANREFILPAPPVDWRHLYCCATKMLRNESPGLQNRRRIWHILDHEMPLLELCLKNESNIAKGPYQDDDKAFPGQWSPVASGEFPKVHESMGRDMQESVRMSELKSGYRVFEKQVLDWTQSSASENVILAVTFLHHPLGSFINGMRLMCGDGLDTEELSRVGYAKVDDEKEVVFSKRDTLTAISVRLVREGITGICFHMEGDDGEYTQEFGNFAKLHDKSGVAQIHCGEILDKIQFLLELDAWKLVSIRLSRVESNSDVKASVVPVSLAEIWSPTLPLKRCPQWISPETNAPRGFNLCMHADMGGADGGHLKSVTSVTFFMGRYPHVFLGMGVSHKDGSERLFGNKSYRSERNLQRCLVQTFVIAGEDGERIQEVTTERCRSQDVICGISLRTNFNRRKVFRFEGLFYNNSYRTTTVAPAGQIILGFFLKFKYSAGEMRDIVADITEATAELRPRLKPAPDSNWEEAPAPGEDPDPGWRDGHLFAKARLSGVRRIHLSSVSSEALAPHWGPSYITGMRLDYFDGHGSTILGQWLKPYATLELVPGETITEVSIEHGVANRYSQRQKFGPLLGMEIVTSRGRKVGKIQHPPPKGDAIRLKFTENPYEMFDTITWSCDNLHDHVRIQYARNTRAHHGDGDLYLAVPVTYPDGKFRQSVVEKIFLKGEIRNGNPDPVVAVEVTFKSLSDEPSSLSFLLESGSVWSLGTRRERPVIQYLEAGERLTRIDASFLGTEQKIASISLSTSTKRHLIMMHQDQIDRHAVTKGKWEITPLKNPLTASNLTYGGRVFDLPDLPGEFVGMWAILDGADRTLTYFTGPIFETRTGGGNMSYI